MIPGMGMVWVKDRRIADTTGIVIWDEGVVILQFAFQGGGDWDSLEKTGS